MTRPVLGGVLVGGQSLRMGQPKQLLDVGGGTMIERVARTLSGTINEIFLLGDGPVPAAISDLPRVADADDCRGPMAGILGALRAQTDACWVVAPCDLPLIRPSAVRWLLQTRRAGAWAVLPRFEGFVEPLFALYEPEAVTLLEGAVADGDYALHRLARSSRVATVEPPSDLRRCWFNANTPQELLSLRSG